MADPAFGSQAVVTVDFESAWGTAKVTPVGRKIGVTQCGIVPTQALIDNPTLRGDFNPADAATGRKAAQGPLNLVANVAVMPFITKWLTGTLVKSGTADPWTATSKLGTTKPASAIVEVDYDIAGTHRYALASGCRINSVTFPISFEGFLALTMDVMAKDVVLGSSAYDTPLVDWATGTPFDHMQLATADVKVGGSAVAYIRGGQVQVNANLYGDDYRVGGGGTRGSLVPGTYGISGNLDLALDSAAVISLITSSTPTTIDLTWTSGTNRSFRLYLPRVVLEKTGPALNDAGITTIPVNFRAAYDGTAVTAIQMVTSLGVDPDTEYA
jgi:hypothetical protein